MKSFGLSYKWWVMRDSNPRPPACKADAVLVNSEVFLLFKKTEKANFLFFYFYFMAEKEYQNLSENNPLVRQYLIIETVFLQKTPNKSVVKYVVKQKKDDQWQDIVKSQFIDNPNHVDYSGRSLQITTEIV